MCNQCLQLLTVWVRIPFRRGVQHYVIKFISDLRQVGGFLRVLRFPRCTHIVYFYIPCWFMRKKDIYIYLYVPQMFHHSTKMNDVTHKRPSWPWLYGSWIYNYMCNQCLQLLTVWVRIPFRRGVQHYVIKFTSCLPMFGGYLRVLRLLPTLKLVAMIQLKYCWKWR
jgi:hypothetical protein